MAADQHGDLYDRVAAVRAEAFEVLQALGRSAGDAGSSERLSLAAVRMQSIANQLGIVETLVSPDRKVFGGAPPASVIRDLAEAAAVAEAREARAESRRFSRQRPVTADIEPAVAARTVRAG